MVLWVGASLVLNGELTLGQLIAFRIISGYVTQPLLRLSTIWQRIQELRVSFERLADIVDTPKNPQELDQGKIPLPPLSGQVSFEDLQFRFGAGTPQVLKNINLTIPAGTFVGVVGQSGSGKSTLMKLLPRLYSPEAGGSRSMATTSTRWSSIRSGARSASCPKSLCCSPAASATTLL